MRRAVQDWFVKGVSAGSSPFSDLLNNTPVYWNAANKSTMFVETANGGAPSTPVVNDGDSVGTIYNLGFGGWFWRTAGNVNRPVWHTDGAKCWITWDTGQTPLINQLVSMRNYMRPVHAVTPSYRGVIHMRYDSDTLLGGAGDIWTTKDVATNTAAGTLIRKVVTTGKNFVRGGNATTMILNNTGTTAGKLAADGWFYLFWDQSGTTFRIFFDDIATAQTITASGVGADVVSSQGCDYGSPSISMAWSKIETGTWDVASVAAAKLTSTVPNNDYWASMEGDFDMHTACYADSTLATPSTDGTVCRAIKNLLVTPFGTIASTNGTSASDVASPIWRANSINGRGAAEYDGTGNMLTTWNRILLGSNGARTWRLSVFKNLDGTDGSHLGTGGAVGSYIAETGGSYASPSQEATHGGVSGSDPTNQPYKTAGQNYNVMTMFRDAAVYYSYNGNGLSSLLTGAHTSAVAIAETGTQGQAGWYTHGPLAYLKTGTGYFPESYRLGLIAQMNTLFAL